MMIRASFNTVRQFFGDCWPEEADASLPLRIARTRQILLPHEETDRSMVMRMILRRRKVRKWPRFESRVRLLKIIPDSLVKRLVRGDLPPR